MAEFGRCGAVAHLEARRSCQELRYYRPHAHDSLSVGAIDAGTSVLTVLGSKIRLVPGDVIVIPAGHVHACNPDQGRWQYQMIHMDQAWAASLAPDQVESSLFGGVRVFRDRELHSRVDTVTIAIFNSETRETLEPQVTDLLAELEATPPTHLATKDADPDLVARLVPVMDRLRTDQTNPSLTDLAGLVGMSKYQLIRAMRRATGLSPLAWRQNARIAVARHMLREGRPISETAHALGFSDQSHFHRVFSRHVAASPGAYQG